MAKDNKDGHEKRTVSFYLNHEWTKHREAFHRAHHPDLDLIRTEVSMRSRSKLAQPCCICGDTRDRVPMVMHHVRHIRKLSGKRQATGFNRILRMINRKQIPVCTTCHAKIHHGQYDNLKLSDMAYVPR